MRTTKAAVVLASALTFSSLTATPALAEQASPTLSPECQAAVEKAKEDHKAGRDNPGSSTPQDFFTGLISGYGSSGMPRTPDCVKEEAEKQELDKFAQLPEFLMSGKAPEEAFGVYQWIIVGTSAVAAVVQAVAMVAKANPSLVEPLKQHLRSVGIIL